MNILLKAIYRFNAIPIKLPMAFFIELNSNFKICMETHKILNSHSRPEKEKRSWRSQTPWLHTVLQSTVIKTVWSWYANGHIDQQNKTESLEINPCTYGHLIFGKGGKNIQWRKGSFFNKCCWIKLTTCQRMKLEYSLTQYTKISSLQRKT